MNIAIVTDSTSDIPRDLAEVNRISVIPNYLMINDQSYLDGEGITREEFYQQLSSNKKPPTTAAPSIAVYIETYQRLLDQGASHILSIHPSGALSALYSIASAAAREFPSMVTTFDSTQATMGLGFLVLHAAQMVQDCANVEQIIHGLDHLKDRVRVVALLDTLEFVRRSGRVNWVTSSLGNMLGLKAIIELRQGLVHRIGLGRTRAKAFLVMLAYLHKLGTIDQLAFLHTTPPAQNEVDLLSKSLSSSKPNILSVPVTTIIGTHVGPGGIGVAAVLQ